MAGLFGILDVGKSGLFGQQEAINVTSHNISNANTDGYTRERAELQASLPATANPGQMGTGVDVVDIKRIRDTFLDYAVRSSKSTDGKYNGMDTFLSQVENVLNEPNDDSTGFSDLVGQFFDAWNTLGQKASDYDAYGGVEKAAVAIADGLNQMSAKLTQLKENSQQLIQESVVDNVNSSLDKVNALNQQIKQLEIVGQSPNDLMDERDLLLDNLSEEFGISIDSKAYGTIDLTASNETDSTVNNYDGRPPLTSDGGNVNLVESDNPDGGARFSYINDIEPADGQQAGEAGNYTVTYYKNGDVTSESNKVTITVNIKDTGTPGKDGYVSASDKYKKLDHSRVLWADNTGAALKVDRSSKSQGVVQGTIADKASVNFEDLALFQAPSGKLNGYAEAQDDIDEYQNELNNEAKAFAFSVNGIISQSSTAVNDTSTNINNFFINSSETSVYTGTDLSKIEEAEKDITAANITVNAAIVDNPNLIKAAAQYDSNGNKISADSDGTRALAIEMLRQQKMSISAIDASTDKEDFLKDMFVEDSTIGSTPIYSIKGNQTGMTVDTYFRTTITKLGMDEKKAKDAITTNSNILNNSLEDRSSTSGVSLDEEMTNLIQFQHCYQANAKIISTVDQLLDVVVNGLRK